MPISIYNSSDKYICLPNEKNFSDKEKEMLEKYSMKIFNDIEIEIVSVDLVKKYHLNYLDENNNVLHSEKLAFYHKSNIINLFFNESVTKLDLVMETYSIIENGLKMKLYNIENPLIAAYHYTKEIPIGNFKIGTFYKYKNGWRFFPFV